MTAEESEKSDIVSAIGSRRRQHRSRIRTLNRAVFLSCIVFLPVYIGIRLTGGSAEKLNKLPDLLDRVKTPIRWEVPDDGVRYLQFHHGDPAAGHKFVLVTVQLHARMKIGYPIIPKCFRVVATDGSLYFAKSRSPLFIAAGAGEFHLDMDESIEGELLFEIPAELKAQRLLFERFSEDGPRAESDSA